MAAAIPSPNAANDQEWKRVVASTLNAYLQRPSYLSLFVDGAPTADQQLLRAKFSQPLTLVPDHTKGDAGVAATGSSVFSIKVSGSDIGTITFGAGQTTGTVAFTSTEVPELALFEVYAPNPADATLADVSLSLAIAR